MKAIKYKEQDFCIVQLPRDKVIELINDDKTIPEIHNAMPQFTYEQVYDSILNDIELNLLYRKHAQKKLIKKI